MMKLVNPVYGETQAPDHESRSDHDWVRQPIVLFDNSKPNAKELLQGIVSRVAERMGRSVPFGVARKEHAALAAKPEQLAELASQYAIALVGAGD